MGLTAKGIIKRGDQSVGYMVAIYATLLTIITAIVGFLVLPGYIKAIITIVIVIALYRTIFFTSVARRFLFKEIARMQEFEEK